MTDTFTPSESVSTAENPSGRCVLLKNTVPKNAVMQCSPAESTAGTLPKKKDTDSLSKTALSAGRSSGLPAHQTFAVQMNAETSGFATGTKSRVMRPGKSVLLKMTVIFSPKRYVSFAEKSFGLRFPTSASVLTSAYTMAASKTETMARPQLKKRDTPFSSVPARCAANRSGQPGRMRRYVLMNADEYETARMDRHPGTDSPR